MLLALLLIACSTAAGTPTVELWFWGYGDTEVHEKGPHLTLRPSVQLADVPTPALLQNSCTPTQILGCYNDSAWNDQPTPGRRVLQHKVSLPPGVPLSQAACAAACCAGGYGADPTRPADVPVAG